MTSGNREDFVRNMQTGCVVRIKSSTIRANTFYSQETPPTRATEMEKLRSGLLAVSAACCCAAYAQAQVAPSASPTSQKVSWSQIEESCRASALSSNASVLQASDGQTALQPEQTAGSPCASPQDAPVGQQPPDPQWQYGGFLDAAYLLDFNHPSHHLVRSRSTAYKVDEPLLDMADAYLRKTATESSRWGMELTLQGGQDSKIFGFSATAPNLPGSEWLRHLGPTDVSYLASVGKGLTVQAGIFSSFIGYDSLYAKDNFNYTRPWGADFTPYLMMGVNASYPIHNKLTGTVFVVNGYWHLADANHVPSSGGQVAYNFTHPTPSN